MRHTAAALALLAACSTAPDGAARIADEACGMLERAETISEAAATVVLGSAARDARDAGISLDDLDRAMQDRCPEEYRQALDA